MKLIILLCCVSIVYSCYFFKVENLNLEDLKNCEGANILFTTYTDNNYFQQINDLFIYMLNFEDDSKELKLNNNFDNIIIYYLNTTYNILTSEFYKLKQLKYLRMHPYYIIRVNKNLTMEDIACIENKNNINVVTLSFEYGMNFNKSDTNFYTIVNNTVFYNDKIFKNKKRDLMFL